MTLSSLEINATVVFFALQDKLKTNTRLSRPVTMGYTNCFRLIRTKAVRFSDKWHWNLPTRYSSSETMVIAPPPNRSNKRAFGSHSLKINVSEELKSAFSFIRGQTGSSNIDHHRSLFHHIDLRKPGRPRAQTIMSALRHCSAISEE